MEKQATGLIRWFLKYHKVVGCTVEGCDGKGNIAVQGPYGYSSEACEYCFMVFSMKKLVEESKSTTIPNEEIFDLITSLYERGDA